jgi:hypothetical protein
MALNADNDTPASSDSPGVSLRCCKERVSGVLAVVADVPTENRKGAGFATNATDANGFLNAAAFDEFEVLEGSSLMKQGRGHEDCNKPCNNSVADHNNMLPRPNENFSFRQRFFRGSLERTRRGFFIFIVLVLLLSNLAVLASTLVAHDSL